MVELAAQSESVDTATYGTGYAGPLTRSLANDLNNLLGTILANSELLRRALGKNHPEIHALDAIELAVERAGGLTEYLQALASPGQFAGRSVDLNQIACHVLRAEEWELAPDIRIVRSVHPDLRRIHGDQAALSEMLTILVRNAVESIPGVGKVVIRTTNLDVDAAFAQTHPGLEPGPHVGVWVEDTGRGIPRGVRRQIFSPDFSSKGAGRGQGLSIALRIVRQHGGHISVESEEGVGSMFRAYIPALPQATERTEDVDPPMFLTGTETILCIDDEELLLSVTKEALGLLGYSVLTASSAREGLHIASNHDGPIHLAIVDLTMPEMGGEEACVHLRELRPDTSILVYSGDPNGDRVLERFEGHIAGYLQKPFRLDALGRAIRSALQSERG